MYSLPVITVCTSVCLSMMASMTETGITLYDIRGTTQPPDHLQVEWSSNRSGVLFRGVYRAKTSKKGG